LKLHKKWINGEKNGIRANLRRANLSGANLDYSCFPLWCGSLYANMDDRQVKQLLYHTLSIVINSDNVSDDLKSILLTEQNLNVANEFHRVDECGRLIKVMEDKQEDKQ
jgi:uncharacterized protein YjbI with pentapeptide repeats